MAISNRTKVGLIFAAISIVLIGLGILLIKLGEGEWNDPECEGHWDLFGLSDCEYEQTESEKSAEDLGVGFGCAGICSFVVAVWMLFSEGFRRLFGKKSNDQGEIDFVPASTSAPVIEDEFAELDEELSSLE
jgi:hypothetical protein